VRALPRVVTVVVSLLLAASCNKGPSGKAAGFDRSSPDKLIASFRAAVAAWDTRAMFDCFDVPEEQYQEFVDDLSKDKDEVVTCMRDARLGDTKPTEDGRLYFGLLNCPAKRGKLTGTMIQKPDGSWRIQRM